MVLANLQSVQLLQLNHVHRTRDVVIRNDTKLRNDADREISDDNTYLDQGFTRPKVYRIKNVEILSICSVETLTEIALLDFCSCFFCVLCCISRVRPRLDQLEIIKIC
jgi:hypothetical protein